MIKRQNSCLPLDAFGPSDVFGRLGDARGTQHYDTSVVLLMSTYATIPAKQTHVPFFPSSPAALISRMFLLLSSRFNTFERRL